VFRHIDRASHDSFQSPVFYYGGTNDFWMTHSLI
jgi:hypothetical protein